MAGEVSGGGAPNEKCTSSAASRQGTQGIVSVRSKVVGAAAGADQCEVAPAVDLSRLRRSRHEPAPRPRAGSRDPRQARCSDCGSEASTHGVGQRQFRHGLRPRAVPAGHPAQAPDCAACRDHGGGRVLQGVRVRLSAWEADATRVDVGGARRANWCEVTATTSKA